MKSVKVHDDTHRALKRLKAKSRSRSIDKVIRDMVRETTGTPVDRKKEDEDSQLTTYLKA